MVELPAVWSAITEIIPLNEAGAVGPKRTVTSWIHRERRVPRSSPLP